MLGICRKRLVKRTNFQNSPSYWRASCSKISCRQNFNSRDTLQATHLTLKAWWLVRAVLFHFAQQSRVRRETRVHFLKRFYSKILHISTMVSPKIRFIWTRVNATTFSCNGVGFKMNAKARVDQNVVCYLAIHSSSFAIRNASTRNQRCFNEIMNDDNILVDYRQYSRSFHAFWLVLAFWGFGLVRTRISVPKRGGVRGLQWAYLCSYIGESYFLPTGKVKPELCPYSNCDFVTVWMLYLVPTDLQT